MKGAPITTGVSAARVGADGAALPSAAPPSLPDAAHPATSAITAIATPPLTIDFIRQHPHGQCVKIGAIIVQYRTIITGEQIGGIHGTVGFEQGRLDRPVGPAAAERLQSVGGPLGQ